MEQDNCFVLRKQDEIVAFLKYTFSDLVHCKCTNSFNFNALTIKNISNNAWKNNFFSFTGGIDYPTLIFTFGSEEDAATVDFYIPRNEVDGWTKEDLDCNAIKIFSFVFYPDDKNLVMYAKKKKRTMKITLKNKHYKITMIKHLSANTEDLLV